MSWFTSWLARRYGGMPQFYEALNRPMEEAGLGAIRVRLAGDLGGRILEVGCGTGLNFGHYAAGAMVVAVEPLEAFRAFAAARARTVHARVTVVAGNAHALPFPDHAFDAALQTLVFCSVRNPLHALRELRRVMRPGAPLRFFEHVRSERVIGALLQDLANPLWRRLMDGCNLNRETVAAIRAAGFVVERVQAHELHVPRSPHFPMREIHARA